MNFANSRCGEIRLLGSSVIPIGKSFHRTTEVDKMQILALVRLVKNDFAVRTITERKRTTQKKPHDMV